MTELREPSLNVRNQNLLNEQMEIHYPDTIGFGELVDSWLVVNRYPSHILRGVYKLSFPDHDIYYQCSFENFTDSHTVTCSIRKVEPVFEHVGWKST